jgi:hypothetical protein
MTPPPCSDCGHIAYFHTEFRDWRMHDVPCRYEGCDCPSYLSGLVSHTNHQAVKP